MAVTLSVGEFAVSLRIATSVDVNTLEPSLVNILTRQLRAATELVEHRAPDAPETTQNLATARVGAYLYDNNPARRGGGADVWRDSGASTLLAPWTARAIGAV